MADNNFRSDRGRDPLAELARLIGRSDPQGDSAAADERYAAPRAYPEEQRGYSDEQYAYPEEQRAYPEEQDRYRDDGRAYPEEHDQYRDDRRSYPEQQHALPPPPAYAESPQERDPYAEQDETPADRYFAGPAVQFNGFREEAPVYPYDETPRLPSAHPLPSYAAAPGDEYESEPAHYDEEGYAAEDQYYDDTPPPRRRTGLLVIMAVLSLAVVGSAGAFGYRAMFGGSVLPTLPPIIKASNGPNKIAPAAAESSNAGNANQNSAAASGPSENLVSREEQPVAIDPPRPAPRVVSTVPIITGQGSLPPGMGMPPPPPGQTNTGQVASATDSPWPSPPPPATATPASPFPAPPAPAASAEPRRVHTVTIRADQTGSTDAAAPAPAPRSARATTSVPRSTSAGAGGGSAPLSIVPGGQGDAAPPPPAPRARVAPSPMALASTNGTASAPTAAATATATATASAGGYAVQVSSQRSEGEAQAAFRTLQAKYPDQLGGRAPIIRRADLGAKGTYYRALVGPFASAEEAASVCSGLKAAGGSCLVQRN